MLRTNYYCFGQTLTIMHLNFISLQSVANYDEQVVNCCNDGSHGVHNLLKFLIPFALFP